MSKESKPRDRWDQVYTASRARPPEWCWGCGYYRVVHGTHRADCTASPPGCPRCLYYLNMHGVHRADCQNRAA